MQTLPARWYCLGLMLDAVLIQPLAVVSRQEFRVLVANPTCLLHRPIGLAQRSSWTSLHATA